MPEKRTEKTKQPVINDEVLETIPALFPEFTGLAEYELLRRRLAQLATGKQAWLKHIGDDGRIHGALVHIGTPHSRAKHLTPNIAQVPNAKKGGAIRRRMPRTISPSRRLGFRRPPINRTCKTAPSPIISPPSTAVPMRKIFLPV